MINIRPVSDLTHKYTEIEELVLKEDEPVSEEEPVYEEPAADDDADDDFDYDDID